MLRQHSLDYFTPTVDEVGENGKPTGRKISQFDLDMKHVDPKDRVSAETALLKFHTPQMQATAVDMSVSEHNITLAHRLSMLAKGSSPTTAADSTDTDTDGNG